MSHGVHRILNEFETVLDKIYAVYLDGVSGFMHLKLFIENQQRISMSEFGLSLEEIDSRRLGYSNESPASRSFKQLHGSTQKEFKERNSVGGTNEVILGNLCLVQIYNYWDDHYRGIIAKNLGYNKNDLKCDLFGDIGKIRNDIVHHNSVVTKHNTMRSRF